MFGEELRSVEAELSSLCERLDAARLTPGQAMAGAEAIGRCERLLAGLRLLIASALPRDDHFEKTPDRTTARWAARTWGCSLTEATDTLTASHALVDLPVTETAVRAGLLSGPQARAVVDAATVDPAAEADLLDSARRESLHRLRQDATTVKANATSDAQRHTRAHRQRHLRVGCARDGSGGQLVGAGTASDTTTILRALRAKHEDLFHAAAERGERPSYEQLQWDALVAVCRDWLDDSTEDADTAPDTPGANTDALDDGDTDAEVGDGDGSGESGDTVALDRPRTNRRRRERAGAAVKVIYNVDYTAWVRGDTAPGERCELNGFGPVPVAAVREVMLRESPFVAAVLTNAKKVSHVVHFGRRPNALQLTALEYANPVCTREGCDNPILQWDHRIDYAQSRHTVLDELDGACLPDHKLKTHDDWAFVDGTGRRPLVPRTDPRHPKNARRRPSPIPPA